MYLITWRSLIALLAFVQVINCQITSSPVAQSTLAPSSNAGLTTCPTSQTILTTCTSCPAGYIACSATSGVSGSKVTKYGGCAPNTATITAVGNLNGVGLCGYCPGGEPSTFGINGLTATYVCNGVSYTYSVTIAPAAAPTSSSSVSCFAGSETLLLESGATLSMEQVRVGDRVLVSSLDGKSTFYSAVMVSPHDANSIEANFVQLSTVSGKNIKMTADHLVMSGTCGNTLSLVQAGSVRVGACVATVSGEEVVSAVSTTVGGGIYTVVPEKDSLLIVNGIVASPFAVNHMIANAFYNIHRTMLSVAPFVTRYSLISKAASMFGELVAPTASSLL